MNDAPVKPGPPALRGFQPITKVRTLQELWDHPGLKSRMEAILPRHLNADRLLRTLINCGLKMPGLAKVDPMSMLGVAMTLAYLGLEPNTPLQQIFLIPFEVNKWNPRTRIREHIRTDANLIIGYQGYVELIARGERVKDLDCGVIWAGDDWVNERGSHKHFRHIEKFMSRIPGQEPEFAYMHARLMNEGEHTELMTAADVHHIRNMSQGFQAAMRAHDKAVEEGKSPARNPVYADAPWIKYPVAMWKKSALRSGQKWLPKSAELATAISLDEAGDEGRVRFDQVIEGEAVSEGAWEIPANEIENEPETLSAARPTQVQVKEPELPKTALRKAPAKKAATSADEPPPGWDDETQDSAPADAEAGSPPEPSASPAAEAQPPEDGSNASDPSGAAAFEEWLLDEFGDIVGEEPFSDARTFAAMLVATANKSTDLTALLEHNAGAMENARSADKTVVFAFDRGPAEEEQTAGVIVVPLTFDRGKPVVKAYLDAFRAEVASLVAGNFLDFVEMNRAEMAKVPQSTIGLCLKALVEKAAALGVSVPSDLGPSLLQRAAPVQETPIEPPEDPDWKAARSRAEEVRQCGDLNEVNAMSRGIIIVNFGARLEREGKTEIIAFLKKAFDDKRAELKGAST